MAEPISFNESDSAQSFPDGSIISTVVGSVFGEKVFVTCWKFTQSELDQLIRTGKLYVVAFGEQLPMLLVKTNNPIIKESKIHGDSTS